MGSEKTIKITIKNLTEIVAGKFTEFPKYTTQIINLANQNAQGTRPAVVGQLSDLIQECPHKGYMEWGEWYLERNPNAIDDATKRIMGMIENLREAIGLIDERMVRDWVEDLVITKTFIGLNVQEGILKTMSEIEKKTYRLANKDEEGRGIDGYIGDMPVSIKPISYDTKDMLREIIDVNIIYYEKKKDHIKIIYSF